MIRPYIDSTQRLHLHYNTLHSSAIKFHIVVIRFRRAMGQEPVVKKINELLLKLLR